MFRVILNNYPVCRASFNLPSLRSIAVLIRHTNKPRQARAVKLPWGDWDGTNSYFSHDLNLSLSARFCSFLPFHGFVAQQHVWQNRHAMQAMIFLKILKRSGIRVSPLFPIFLWRSKKTIQAGKNKVSWNKFIQSKCKHYRSICFKDEGVDQLRLNN